jgi:hypothetical protein
MFRCSKDRLRSLPDFLAHGAAFPPDGPALGATVTAHGAALGSPCPAILASLGSSRPSLDAAARFLPQVEARAATASAAPRRHSAALRGLRK